MKINNNNKATLSGTTMDCLESPVTLAAFPENLSVSTLELNDKIHCRKIYIGRIEDKIKYLDTALSLIDKLLFSLDERTPINTDQSDLAELTILLSDAISDFCLDGPLIKLTELIDVDIIVKKRTRSFTQDDLLMSAKNLNDVRCFISSCLSRLNKKRDKAANEIVLLKVTRENFCASSRNQSCHLRHEKMKGIPLGLRGSPTAVHGHSSKLLSSWTKVRHTGYLIDRI